MRIQAFRQQYLDFTRPSSVKVVKEYCAKYEAIGELLEANPELVCLAHEDFSTHLSESQKGRESGFTSEEILRALVVMFMEQDSYRDVVVRIDNSEFLRSFVGLGVKPMMDFTFLSKAFSALSDRTWKAMNETLACYAEQEEKISGARLRADTTVYETNIHYPTDSSLLWDGFRTLARELKQIQREWPELELRHRFHTKKVKKLAYFISRNSKSRKKRTQFRVKSAYRKLVERVRWIVRVSAEARDKLAGIGGDASELERYEPTVQRIIYQAYQRVFAGVKLSADEKVYSLFEEHTELLKRGKAGKPIEFGHKVLVAQSGEKFITHYRTLPQREEDSNLLEETLESHHRLFGQAPEVLAGDRGFYASSQQLDTLGEEIETVSIHKQGRRTARELQRESTEAFKAGQRFRAGSEGSISVLKRAFKLNRCLFKGFKNFAASVGCAVFCHNLVMLTRL